MSLTLKEMELIKKTPAKKQKQKILLSPAGFDGNSTNV